MIIFPPPLACPFHALNLRLIILSTLALWNRMGLPPCSPTAHWWWVQQPEASSCLFNSDTALLRREASPRQPRDQLMHGLVFSRFMWSDMTGMINSIVDGWQHNVHKPSNLGSIRTLIRPIENSILHLCARKVFATLENLCLIKKN
jgi:hypothetical protein